MSLHSLVLSRLLNLLEDRRIVVWYDGENAFRDVAETFAAPGCRTIYADPSTLQARHDAEAVARRINDNRHPKEKGGSLLVYVSWERGRTDEERVRDPFEGFVLQGAAFGDKDGEKIHSLARQAMPERIAEIDRLFREGEPTVGLLDNLETGGKYPLLREALGAESAVEAAAQLLCRDGTVKKLVAVQGATDELMRLLKADLGFEPPLATKALDGVRKSLETYVLLSEYTFDSQGELPGAWAYLPRADEIHRERIFALCDRMRGSDDTREGYVLLAAEAERVLRVQEMVSYATACGARDTFPHQEAAYLRRLEEVAAKGELAEARTIIETGRRSIWRHQPERAVRWKVAERCLDFLAAAETWEKKVPGPGSSVRDWVHAYAAPEGLSCVDRAQRLVEQGAAACAEDAEIAGLVDMCRRKYRDVVDGTQQSFLKTIEKEGWPPEGVLRQSQTFDRHVSPALAEGRKVVLFLVDAMRYEMGRDLASALEESGATTVAAGASVAPATTAFGMAALMPGADGAISLVERGGVLIPTLGGRPLPDSASRMELLRGLYGDRFADVTLSELLSMSQRKLAGTLAKADLIVVRTQEIDDYGEGISLYQARKMITEVLGELVDATKRLAGVGFQFFVFAADHGHVLIPEVPAGDVVPDPPGSWKLSKRRCRLGESAAASAGVLVLSAGRMGIVGPVSDLVVPRGYKVFSAGAGYFHEGVSLQECVIPIVTLAAQAKAVTPSKGESVEIRYRSERFTSRIIGLKVSLVSLLSQQMTIRMEAFDGPGAKAKLVGEAADCDARDAVTGLITVKRGTETQVPLVLREEFSGPEIEVRAIDASGPGVILHRLRLKNGMLE